jgi:glycosyltransferase involved in cell wall biosynthesis
MKKKHIAIITPVFNDWNSFHKLVKDIDEALETLPVTVSIIPIDDGSTQSHQKSLFSAEKYRVIRRIEIIHLARNTGHQRAIAIGLSYFENKHKADHIIVMDADGEDRPANLMTLLDRQTITNEIVFAKRGQRKEGGAFRVFNQIYRLLFTILTGKHIQFGNFCAIPGHQLRQVVFLPEIWSHFAAGVLRSGLPQSTVTIDRGKRYQGSSKMNFASLVMHGLSAFSVYTDILSVRMMLLTLIVILATFVAAGILVYVKYLTPLAIPGWATTVGFGLLVILFQSFLMLLSIAFNVLNSRPMQMYIPAKHFQDFILNIEVCYERR